MLTCFLKRILPFTLTFIIGAAAGGFFTIPHRRPASREEILRAYSFSEDGGHHCRARTQRLLAESKPLVIIFKPDAQWPLKYRGLARKDFLPVLVRVTFGADGEVHKVQPTDDVLARKVDVLELMMFVAASTAARHIQFEPETINNVPISVMKEIEINFMADPAAVK